MIPNEVWNEIESPFFAANLGVVSTPRAFDAALLHQPVVVDLIQRLSSGESPDAVLERVNRLLREPSDSRYCHPRDLAIGVYFRVIDVCAPEAVLTLARLALTLPNLWWGKVMAARIEAARRDNSSVVVTFTAPAEGVVRRSQNSKASRLQPTTLLRLPSNLLGNVRTQNNSTLELAQLNVTPIRTRNTTTLSTAAR